MRASTIIWLVLSVILLLVGRLLVPTQIDYTLTAFYKDVAHIFWGCLITYALMRRSYPWIIATQRDRLAVTSWKPSWFLFWTAWAFAFFELAMAILT